jgi:glycosyltransferase involved in cell wall biosynthesis
MRNVSLKITHLASGDLWAGAEVQLFTLCDSLKNDFNQHIEVILLNDGELASRLRDIDIEVHILDESKLNTLTIILEVIRILKASEPHIVHTHRFKENIIGGLAAFFSGGIPSLRSCHGHAEHFHKWFRVHKRVLYFIEYIIGKFLQKKIVAVSEQLSESLEKIYPSTKVMVIENGVNTRSLQPFVKRPMMQHLTNEKVDYRIGLVGRLVEVKRVDKFIDFAEHWQKSSNISCSFLIYGDGPLEKALKTQALNTSCRNQIIFHGHTDQIYSAISALDVLVFISDHEGLPMTLLESMVIGTPVLSVAVGGIPKMLGNGKYGTLVENQSAASFTEKLKYLLNNFEDTNQKSFSAQKQISENNSAKQNAKQFINLYRSIQLTDN